MEDRRREAAIVRGIVSPRVYPARRRLSRYAVNVALSISPPIPSLACVLYVKIIRRTVVIISIVVLCEPENVSFYVSGTRMRGVFAFSSCSNRDESETSPGDKLSRLSRRFFSLKPIRRCDRLLSCSISEQNHRRDTVTILW